MAGLLILACLLGGYVWYLTWLKNGVKARHLTTDLDPDTLRDLFLAKVCHTGWHVVDDGNPLVAQSSLVTGTRQQIGLTLRRNDRGTVDVTIQPLRLRVKVWPRVPVKAHTLRIRMSSFVAGVHAAERAAGLASDGGARSAVRGLEGWADDDAAWAVAPPVAADPRLAPSPPTEIGPSSIPQGPLPEDGWYPDPLDGGGARLWRDGAWTDRTQPLPRSAGTTGRLAPTAVAPAPHAATSTWPAADRSGWPPPDDRASDPHQEWSGVLRPDLGAGPRAIAGWWVPILAGALLMGGCFLPFASVSGTSIHPMVQPDVAGPLFAIAAAAVIGGLLAAAGYESAFGLAGGAGLAIATSFAVTSDSTFAALGLAGPDDSSVSPGVGAFCMVLAATLGLVAGLMALARTQQPGDGGRVPPVLGLLAVVGAGLYVVELLVPPIDGVDIWAADAHVNVFRAALIALAAVPAVALLVRGSAAAGAMVVGGLLLPATAWFVAAVSPQNPQFGLTIFDSGQVAGIGLALALGAGAVAAAVKARRATGGVGRGTSVLAANPAGGLLVGVAFAAMGLIGVATETAHEHDLQASTSGFVDETSSSYDSYGSSYEEPASDSSSPATYRTTTTESYRTTTTEYSSPYPTEYCVNQHGDTTPLNIRRGPGTEYSVLGTIPQGRCGVYDARSSAEVESSVNGYPWRHVSFDGISGWVSDSAIYER